MLPRRHRLTRASDIARVRVEGKRVRTGMLEVRGAASLLAYPRVAVVVAKHGHGSVERNQLKRRLRELIRTTVLPHVGAVDLVWRAAPGAYDASFEALSLEVAELGHAAIARWPATQAGAS